MGFSCFLTKIDVFVVATVGFVVNGRGHRAIEAMMIQEHYSTLLFVVFTQTRY